MKCTMFNLFNVLVTLARLLPKGGVPMTAWRLTPGWSGRQLPDPPLQD